MGSLERFKIELKGQTEENASYEFMLDNDYFDAIEATEVKGGMLHATLDVHKTAGVYELNFHIEGETTVVCDVCLDDLQQPVCTDSTIIARLGERYSDEEEVITVPEEEGILDVSWLLYEMIALAIPTRHVHAEGECNAEMLTRIDEMTARMPEEDETDPRWKELEKLKSTIKE